MRAGKRQSQTAGSGSSSLCDIAATLTLQRTKSMRKLWQLSHKYHPHRVEGLNRFCPLLSAGLCLRPFRSARLSNVPFQVTVNKKTSSSRLSGINMVYFLHQKVLIEGQKTGQVNKASQRFDTVRRMRRTLHRSNSTLMIFLVKLKCDSVLSCCSGFVPEPQHFFEILWKSFGEKPSWKPDRKPCRLISPICHRRRGGSHQLHPRTRLTAAPQFPISPFCNNFSGLLQTDQVATPGDRTSFHFSLLLSLLL